MDTGSLINALSTTTDYIRGISAFAVGTFEAGADTYERIRDRIESISESDDSQKNKVTYSDNKRGFLESITQDTEKSIALLAVAVLVGGLIIAGKR